MFPVDAQTTALAPSSRAFEMASVMPLSLKDPVGLRPSIFKSTRACRRSDNFGAGSSGVPPSKRVTTGVASVTGRSLRYASIIPGHCAISYTSS